MEKEDVLIVIRRKLLERQLKNITYEQLELFNKIFPKGVPDEKLETAIDLCQRTITKNREKNENA